MCTRFTLIHREDAIASRFDVTVPFRMGPRYNIAPGQPVLIVRGNRDCNAPREVTHVRWGFVPSWADDVSIGSRMINARRETVAEKTSYRHAYRRRRCLIPADGYYAWGPADKGGARTPVHVTHSDGLFALAGLWEHWQSKDNGSELETCTVLTTASAVCDAAPVGRMPVIIPREAFGLWLAHPLDETTHHVNDLLAPCLPAHLMAVAVGTYVNHAAHEGPQCIEPAEPVAPDTDPPTGSSQLPLFG